MSNRVERFIDRIQGVLTIDSDEEDLPLSLQKPCMADPLYGEDNDDDIDEDYDEEELDVEDDDDELPSREQLKSVTALLGFDPREIEDD